MKFCKICLQPDTRPNTVFSDHGICPACSYSQSLQSVDWNERIKEIEPIVEFGRKHSDSGHDCIIGVSGGKDSTRQALYVRDQLGMRPLLVALCYPPLQISQRGVDNLSNLIDLGFDVISINPAPITWRDLMKKGFDLYANWCKSTEYSLFSSVPRLAIAYQIPLIWWGENPALQLGDMGALGKTGHDGSNLKNMNTLGGGDISWLLSEDVRPKDILQYKYPSNKEMERANLKIVYLGYFWKNWSLIDNAIYSCLHGLDVRDEPPEEIGDLYGVTAVDESWVTFNQMIKYLKFGFGRVTDYVNEDIRLGRISREQGIKLVEKFDGEVSEKYIRGFCQFLEITESQFWEKIRECVNKDLFYEDGKNNWIPKFKIGEGLL